MSVLRHSALDRRAGHFCSRSTTIRFHTRRSFRVSHRMQSDKQRSHPISQFRRHCSSDAKQTDSSSVIGSSSSVVVDDVESNNSSNINESCCSIPSGSIKTHSRIPLPSELSESLDQKESDVTITSSSVITDANERIDDQSQSEDPIKEQTCEHTSRQVISNEMLKEVVRGIPDEVLIELLRCNRIGIRRKFLESARSKGGGTPIVYSDGISNTGSSPMLSSRFIRLLNNGGRITPLSMIEHCEKQMRDLHSQLLDSIRVYRHSEESSSFFDSSNKTTTTTSMMMMNSVDSSKASQLNRKHCRLAAEHLLNEVLTMINASLHSLKFGEHQTPDSISTVDSYLRELKHSHQMSPMIPLKVDPHLKNSLALMHEFVLSEFPLSFGFFGRPKPAYRGFGVVSEQPVNHTIWNITEKFCDLMANVHHICEQGRKSALKMSHRHSSSSSSDAGVNWDLEHPSSVAMLTQSSDSQSEKEKQDESNVVSLEILRVLQCIRELSQINALLSDFLEESDLVQGLSDHSRFHSRHNRRHKKSAVDSDDDSSDDEICDEAAEFMRKSRNRRRRLNGRRRDITRDGSSSRLRNWDSDDDDEDGRLERQSKKRGDRRRSKSARSDSDSDDSQSDSDDSDSEFDSDEDDDADAGFVVSFSRKHGGVGIKFFEREPEESLSSSKKKSDKHSPSKEGPKAPPLLEDVIPPKMQESLLFASAAADLSPGLVRQQQTKEGSGSNVQSIGNSDEKGESDVKEPVIVGGRPSKSWRDAAGKSLDDRLNSGLLTPVQLNLMQVVKKKEDGSQSMKEEDQKEEGSKEKKNEDESGSSILINNDCNNDTMLNDEVDVSGSVLQWHSDHIQAEKEEEKAKEQRALLEQEQHQQQQLLLMSMFGDRLTQVITLKEGLHKEGYLGLDEFTVKSLKRCLIARCLPPSLCSKLSMQPTKGILLHGPPGTGKTMLASLMGKLIGVKSDNIKIVNGPEIEDSYIGQTEKNIRKQFIKAKNDWHKHGVQSDLHLVIFDEIDSLCRKRDSGPNSKVADKAVQQLLSVMDGLESMHNVIVIGTTNRYDLIDPALLRPGRLDVHLYIPPPESDQRRVIIGRLLQFDNDSSIDQDGSSSMLKVADDVGLDWLVDMTEGMVQADLRAVKDQAVMNAVERIVNDSAQNEEEHSNVELKLANELGKVMHHGLLITANDLLNAVDLVRINQLRRDSNRTSQNNNSHTNVSLIL